MPLGRRKAVSAIGGLAVIALGLNTTSAGAGEPPSSPAAEAVARGLGISTEQARDRLARQHDAHRVLASLPASLRSRLAGTWFDDRTGTLTVAVTSAADANHARAAGATPKVVGRGAEELGALHRSVGKLAGRHVPGLSSFGIDDPANVVQVSVDPSVTSPATTRFLERVRGLGAGVQVRAVRATPVQQAGEVNPGDPCWPGGESNCSVGFGATDAQGGKHFVTAGHCTNDASQPAYGASGQQNRLGTSNVGGSRSVNAEEGDMGVVAVTEAGWTISAAVNTWGQPAVTVTGSAEAIVGEAVCHTGNTAPNWECGEVTKVNQDVDYGHIVKGLTITTACSQGGDSGGAWLRGDKAVGLHSGAVNGNSCPAGDNAIFQPVNEALTKWGLTLYTGAAPAPPRPASHWPGTRRSTTSA
jgi:streptogrisin C